jgi:hypothetical protein
MVAIKTAHSDSREFCSYYAQQIRCAFGSEALLKQRCGPCSVPTFDWKKPLICAPGAVSKENENAYIYSTLLLSAVRSFFIFSGKLLSHPTKHQQRYATAEMAADFATELSALEVTIQRSITGARLCLESALLSQYTGVAEIIPLNLILDNTSERNLLSSLFPLKRMH